MRIKILGIILLIIVTAGRLPLMGADGLTNNLPLDNFKKIVILEHGRKKPLDTFAQNVLKQFSGRSKFEKTPAIFWLARVLLDPSSSSDDKIFIINNPEVLNSMGITITGRERDRYSFNQLKGHLLQLRRLAAASSRIDAEKRTAVENELIILFNKLFLYQQLIGSFEFAFPLADFTITDPDLKQELGFPEGQKQFSLYDIIRQKKTLSDWVNKVKDNKEGQLSAEEQKIIALDSTMESRLRTLQGQALTILPSADSNQERWFSPAELLSITSGHQMPVPQTITLLHNMVRAYQDGDAETFDKSAAAFNEAILKKSAAEINGSRIEREILYNKIDPFYRAEFFYGFSLIFLLVSFLVLKKWLYRSSIALLAIGFVLHTAGIILRVMISGRPPVTNLYESIIFTGWIGVLLGFILELFRKKNTGLFTGCVSGLIMLLIAGKYALEGDTMGMLVAVLDSNFWLAIHVITITVGYGGVVISGFIGHLYILQRIFKPRHHELHQNTFQAVYSTQAFGLVFTFIGTVLGGIWADQSWGRFWGWDPKENGALLIVLWSALLFHARLSKMVKELGFTLGSVVGIITVVLAWFGVNLLGVGLHSYGFTSGVAAMLSVFVLFELLFILIAGVFIKYSKLTAHAD